MTDALSNNPPPHAELLDAIHATAEEGSRIPHDFPAEIAPDVVDWLRKASLLLGDAERERKDEKAPSLAESRSIDRTWNDETDALVGVVSFVRERLCTLDLPEQVRGPRGGVASFTPAMQVTITDAAKVPLAKLRPYLSADAIEKAVKKAAEAGVKLPGVKITPRRGVTIR